MTGPSLIIAGWLTFVLLAVRFLWAAWRRQAIEDRLYAPAANVDADDAEGHGPLRRWLHLAGFRSPLAPFVFLAATLVLVALGSAAAWLFNGSQTHRAALDALASLPGGVGEVFLPVLYLGPWLSATLIALAPWLVVRRSRRARLSAVDQDLPVTLELIATLSEAGLGFDAALSKLLDSQPRPTVLSRELRTFQLDLLSGRPRTQSFRRLAARVEAPPLSVFVSAVVQAEQVGAAMATVLRQQALDLRNRRREDAMALAMALPVKRLFPMIICFLPGIFVATLGPTFFEFFQYADTVLRLQSFGGR